jgi:hypothetical protein
MGKFDGFPTSVLLDALSIGALDSKYFFVCALLSFRNFNILSVTAQVDKIMRSSLHLRYKIFRPK